MGVRTDQDDEAEEQGGQGVVGRHQEKEGRHGYEHCMAGCFSQLSLREKSRLPVRLFHASSRYRFSPSIFSRWAWASFSIVSSWARSCGRT